MLFRCQSAVGLKCSFLDDGGKLQTWEYLGGAWAAGSFSQVGAGKLSEMVNGANNFVFTDNSNNANLFIKELYLPDLDDSREYIIRNIKKNKDGVSWSIAITILPDSSDPDIAYFWQATSQTNPEEIKVIELNNQKETGRKGYIVVDWNVIKTEEFSFRAKINIAYSKDAKFSPLISQYLQKYTPNTVSEQNITDKAVTNAKIADKAVSVSKIGDDVSKLINGSSLFAITDNKKNANAFIKELYLVDLDMSKDYILRNVNRGTHTSENIIWSLPIAVKDSEPLEVPYFIYGTRNLESDDIIEFNIGEGKGYALVNWEAIPFGVETSFNALINKEICSKLKYNPAIASYLAEKKSVENFTESSYEDKILEYNSKKYIPNIAATDYTDGFKCEINGQSDFDDLAQSLKTALETNDKVIVAINEGVYKFNENHVYLNDLNYANKDVCITGIGDVKLIGATKEYSIEEGAIIGNRYKVSTNTAFTHSTTFTDGKTLIPISTSDYINDTGVIQMDSLFDIVDEEQKICKGKCPLDITKAEEECGDLYIQIYTWFKTYIYKITKIENGEIYFIADGLSYDDGHSSYNINLDYGYGKKYPRYRILNLNYNNGLISIENGYIFIPCSYKKVFECQNGNFITLNRCNFSSFEITGIKFIGNGEKDGVKRLINFSECNISKLALIHHNLFLGIKSNTVIYVNDTDNVSVYLNDFSHIYGYGIISNNLSANTQIFKNNFYLLDEMSNNYFAVNCEGTDYYVAHNKFVNFTYGAVSVGQHYKSQKQLKSNGIVEFNLIYCTSDYIDRVSQHGLMDAGAIYTFTQNDEAIIRYNVVININGIHSYRGIFCDDGTKNAKIYGNIIGNIHTGYCIDLRRVSAADAYVSDANEGNFIAYNFLLGSYKFEKKGDGDNNINGRNIILYELEKPQNTLTVDESEEDYYINNASIIENLLWIPKSFESQIKKVLSTNFINDFIKFFQ